MPPKKNDRNRDQQRPFPDNLVAGALGGGAPPVVLLATRWTFTNNAELPEATFVIGVLLLAGLGLSVVWVTMEKNRKKAFLVGLGLPAMVNGFVSEAIRLNNEIGASSNEASVRVSEILVPSAYAQVDYSDQRDVFIQVSDGLDGVAVVFLDNENRLLSNTYVSGPQVIKTPSGATLVRFINPAFNSVRAELPDQDVSRGNTIVRYEIDYERKSFSGFLVAMGATAVKKRSLTVDQTTISPSELPQDTDVNLDVSVASATYLDLRSFDVLRLDASRAIEACATSDATDSVIAELEDRITKLERECADLGSDEEALLEQVSELTEENETLRSQLALVTKPSTWSDTSLGIPDRAYFDTNREEPRSEGTDTIRQWAEFLTENRDLSVTLVGHADSIGTPNRNLDLSSRRAAYVKELLTELGVDPDRIQLGAFGEDVPAASSDTPSANALNRRVVIVVN